MLQRDKMDKARVFILCLVCISGTVFAKTNTFAERAEVQKFIQVMTKKHGLNKDRLTSLLQITPDNKVLEAISKPFEEATWQKYRDRFVSTERATAGVAFWKKHEAILKKASTQFGVPAEIIVAIIGVETNYGQNTGKFPVLRTLATLAFDYPKRAPFFKSELKEFLLLLSEEGLDPNNTFGSYAGAMGTPQFMPSSWRRYAVDFSGSGKRNLIANAADAIGSVANYFKAHGWKTGAPIVTKAIVKGTQVKNISIADKKNPKPTLPLKHLVKNNIVPESKLPVIEETLTSLLVLNNAPNAQEYWIGLQNFYVITRYNHSVNYAMAVYQLSERIRALKQKG